LHEREEIQLAKNIERIAEGEGWLSGCRPRQKRRDGMRSCTTEGEEEEGRQGRVSMPDAMPEERNRRRGGKKDMHSVGYRKGFVRGKGKKRRVVVPNWKMAQKSRRSSVNLPGERERTGPNSLVAIM